MSDTVELVKHAKGTRPQFFPDAASDKLLAMVMALAGEVAVLRDRNDTLERLIEEKDILKRSEIEGFRPSKQVLSERDAWREEYLGHILRIMDLDDADMDRNDTSRQWGDIIKLVNK